ncbi:MAG: hypothetical protein HQK49_00120 [Oligoflexia bacterium]|nr:hypothetical protein [Oligoflexia bacterium]
MKIFIYFCCLMFISVLFFNFFSFASEDTKDPSKENKSKNNTYSCSSDPFCGVNICSNLGLGASNNPSYCNPIGRKKILPSNETVAEKIDKAIREVAPDYDLKILVNLLNSSTFYQKYAPLWSGKCHHLAKANCDEKFLRKLIATGGLICGKITISLNELMEFAGIAYPDAYSDNEDTNKNIFDELSPSKMEKSYLDFLQKKKMRVVTLTTLGEGSIYNLATYNMSTPNITTIENNKAERLDFFTQYGNENTRTLNADIYEPISPEQKELIKKLDEFRINNVENTKLFDLMKVRQYRAQPTYKFEEWLSEKKKIEYNKLIESLNKLQIPYKSGVVLKKHVGKIDSYMENPEYLTGQLNKVSWDYTFIEVYLANNSTPHASIYSNGTSKSLIPYVIFHPSTVDESEIINTMKKVQNKIKENEKNREEQKKLINEYAFFFGIKSNVNSNLLDLEDDEIDAYLYSVLKALMENCKPIK